MPPYLEIDDFIAEYQGTLADGKDYRRTSSAGHLRRHRGPARPTST
jgi:hypothetical protein